MDICFLFPNPLVEGGGGRKKGGKGHLWQESLDHEVHAADVYIHGEVPVSLLAVQDGAVVHKPKGGYYLYLYCIFLDTSYISPEGS